MFCIKKKEREKNLKEQGGKSPETVLKHNSQTNKNIVFTQRHNEHVLMSYLSKWKDRMTEENM